MLNFRLLARTAGALVLGCLFLFGSNLSAGDKKEEKKSEKKTSGAAASKFTAKPIDLKMNEGKIGHSTELTENDLKALGRYHYKVFTVQLEKGKVYRIDHKGAGADPKFDPYLMLEDGSGVQLEADDDGAGGLNSRIIYKAAMSGPYRIIATTFVPGQTGKFTIDVGMADPKEAKVAELKFQIGNFAGLSAIQRKTLADDVGKHIASKDGDLTVADFQLTISLGMEAEFENVALAREIYNEGIKHFGAARNEKLANGLTPQLEKALKSLDKLGKTIAINGKTTDNKDFDLKNLKGKVVLVDFWATWCGPCIAELPNMERAYAKYHGKGFDIIGISLDRPGDEEKLSKFMENRKMPWPCINIEDSRTLADLHKVNAIPYPVLVDQQGRVVSFRARGPQLERMLDRLLEEKK